MKRVIIFFVTVVLFIGFTIAWDLYNIFNVILFIATLLVSYMDFRNRKLEKNNNNKKSIDLIVNHLIELLFSYVSHNNRNIYFYLAKNVELNHVLLVISIGENDEESSKKNNNSKKIHEMITKYIQRNINTNDLIENGVVYNTMYLTFLKERYNPNDLMDAIEAAIKRDHKIEYERVLTNIS